MKRLSVLVVALLSMALFFSVVSLADEADKATADLTFNSVLHLDVTNNLSNKTINQLSGGDLNLAEYTADDMVNFGNITATVLSLVPYKVGATVYTSRGGTAVEDGNGSLVDLGSYSLPWFDSGGVSFAYADLQDGSNVGPTAGTQLIEITSEFLPDAGAGNNLDNSPPGDATGNLAVTLDPREFTETDYNDGDILTVDVVLWAYTTSDYPT